MAERNRVPAGCVRGPHHTDAAYARRLHGAILRPAVLGELAAPVSQNTLLDLIVRTAAQVLSAQAASLFLIDRETNELVFEVALGERPPRRASSACRWARASPVWVALSGQPVARSDVAQDARFAGGHAPSGSATSRKTVLCLPLRSGDEVIGVIELFDKTNGQPFSAGDMQVLEQFGRGGGRGDRAERRCRDLARLFVVVLSAAPAAARSPRLRQRWNARDAPVAERTRVRASSTATSLEIALSSLSEIAARRPEARAALPARF